MISQHGSIVHIVVFFFSLLVCKALDLRWPNVNHIIGSQLTDPTESQHRGVSTWGQQNSAKVGTTYALGSLRFELDRAVCTSWSSRVHGVPICRGIWTGFDLCKSCGVSVSRICHKISISWGPELPLGRCHYPQKVELMKIGHQLIWKLASYFCFQLPFQVGLSLHLAIIVGPLPLWRTARLHKLGLQIWALQSL